ncbi:MAG: GerMN domain-containing protein [Acidobacteriota bacterium]|nr:GerMN domain-containing protein [Acidobacteriota bacterium]
MKTIQTLLIAVITIAGLNLSAAAQGSRSTKGAAPDAVVASLYRQHKKQSPFFQTTNRALIDKYFDKQLGDLLWKDAITSKNEVGVIDGDPLYNAQDMEIKKFAIHKAVTGKGTADVVVTFENFGKKKGITFQLVPRRTGWKIANIKYDDGSNMLGWFKEARQSDPTAPPLAHSQEVKIYLVAVGDNGQAGKKIGCDDSLVAVTRPIASTPAPLKAALQELLSTPSQSSGSPKLENFWKGRNLRLTSVSIRGNTATIRISGELFVAGVCDQPRIQGQIEETARQFPSVKRVNVFIGKRGLADAIR